MSALTAVAVVGGVAFASSVSLPHTFEPNRPARAAEVNANFAALKASVDALSARVESSNAASARLDFAPAAAGTCSPDLSVTVPGATTTGSTVALGNPNGVYPGSTFFAWPGLANTVYIRHCCFATSGSCDPPSVDYYVRVFN